MPVPHRLDQHCSSNSRIVIARRLLGVVLGVPVVLLAVAAPVAASPTDPISSTTALVTRPLFHEIDAGVATVSAAARQIVSIAAEPSVHAPAASIPEAGVTVATAPSRSASAETNADLAAHVRTVNPHWFGELARSSIALFALAFAAMAFGIRESVFGHRNPRVVRAPLDRRDAELEFA